MEALLLTLLLISGMLAFSFGLAWLISSVAIVVEQIKIESKKEIHLHDLADIWLTLNDVISILFALEIIKQIPRIIRVIIKKWLAESMLRISFVVSVFSGIVMMTSNYLLWGN